MHDIHSLEVIVKERQRDLLALALRDTTAHSKPHAPGRRSLVGPLLVVFGDLLMAAGDRLRRVGAARDGATGRRRLVPRVAPEGYSRIEAVQQPPKIALGSSVVGVPHGVRRERSHAGGAAV